MGAFSMASYFVSFHFRGGVCPQEKHQNPYWLQIYWPAGVFFFKKLVVFPIDWISRLSISCIKKIWNYRGKASSIAITCGPCGLSPNYG
jgi:hypothetical protein